MPKVGGTKSVNLEKIRALAPTHVIVNVDENRKEVADALAEFVPNVVVTHPLGPLDNLELYRNLGKLFNVEAQAETLCTRFEAEYRRVLKQEFPVRKVLYLIWKDPWMTVSRDTYISRMLALFGLQTLADSDAARYPKISLEESWLRDVELVLLSSEPYRFQENHLAEIKNTLNRPARLIDGAMTSWYGSRAIEGLRYLTDFAASLGRKPS